ncbi:MAG: putative oxidoreductase [Candidatus Ozemobacter sibiricus]|uniref:Putative oxidoreductase n=1 Tax=Candidatus Ozemobacter sibiricus TaxID=2268124 RepID=A0A367ZJJ1_9BACT|nr:MAG: putative oxidoreductase [Candidatus Ozemobacter sibiricus]
MVWLAVAGWANVAFAMEYLEVGEAPGPVLRLSRLIMGTDHLGKVPNEQTIEVLEEAVRLGINAFDTAPIYTDDIEVRLGRWLQTKNRSDLYVITKGGFPRDLGPGTYYSRLRGDARQIMANVFEEASKSRARYGSPIAIYLMHRDDADFQGYRRVERPPTPVATILEALSDPRLRQFYGLIGVSNWETARVEESQRVARDHPGLLRPVCNSPYFSLLEMGSVTIHVGGVQVTHADMMNPEFQKGVRLMTYSPLGGFSIVRPGWEAAKQRALALKQAGDRYWRNVYDAIFHPANEARFRRAEAFAAAFNAKHGTSYTVDQVLNAWVLAHPRTDFVVIGPRTVEQLRRTVQSLELAKHLTPADLDYLYYGERS